MANPGLNSRAPHAEAVCNCWIVPSFISVFAAAASPPSAMVPIWVPVALDAGIAASTADKIIDHDPAPARWCWLPCAGLGTEPMSELGPLRSSAAERMRRHRRRRRKGLRCLLVELRETEIDTLVKKGLLKADARNNTRAIREALYQYFDSTLN
jgi:hypothetical protein